MTTTFETQRAALADVVAIPVTPFAEDGSVDQAGYRALLRRLLDAGVTTLTPNGNTGEFYALTPEERRTVAELTMKETGDGSSVLVGVGHDIPTAVASARHARDLGARMVMVHQPVHPYVSQSGWVDYHRAVAEAVPELGVVPTSATPGSPAPASPNSPTPAQRHRCEVLRTGRGEVRRLRADAGIERFVWVAGLAEPYAPSYFSAGATGFTSGLVNVAPSVSLNMIGALRSGDYATAMKVWEQIRRFEELRGADGSADNVTVVKEALASLGLCRREVRPPSRQLAEHERAEVAAIAAGWSV
ncbi:dihydrodipicolinate synthase family protein [Streptomyces sp. INA 01156]